MRDRIVQRWGPERLLGVPNLTQSAGSASSFAIGTVAGASYTVDVLKPLVQVLPYIDHKTKVLYTFQNDARYYEEGIFYIKDAKENGQKKTTITAYDNCYKLDCAAAPLIAAISYPITAKELFLLVCAYCDIPYNPDISFLNMAQVITEPFGSENTTCREVMEWIAQIAGTIIIADFDGKLIFKDIVEPDRSRGSITANTYDLDSSMIPIQKPNAIQYKYNDDEILIYNIQTTEPHILNYSNNPFCLNRPKADIDTMLTATISNIDALGTIYAWSVTIPNDFYGMSCGDSWVVSSSDIASRRGIITEKRIAANGVTYTSSGEIMALSAEKSLDTQEIANLITSVGLLFHKYQINHIVLKDAVFEETYRTVDTSWEFKIGNFLYNQNGLVFDLSSQFEYMYAGQPDAKVLVNNQNCILNFVEDTLEIVNQEYVNPRLSNITSIVKMFNGNVDTTYTSVNDAWKKSQLPLDVMNPEITFTSEAYENEMGWLLYYLMQSDTQNKYGLAYLLYILQDGQWHSANFISLTNFNAELTTPKGNLYRFKFNVDSVGLQGLRFKYDYSTGTLYYDFNYQIAPQFTINSVKDASGAALTLRNSSGTPITLPITDTSIDCRVYSDNDWIGNLHSGAYGTRVFTYTPRAEYERSNNLALAPNIYYFTSSTSWTPGSCALSNNVLTIQTQEANVIWDVAFKSYTETAGYTWSGYSRPTGESNVRLVQSFDGVNYSSVTSPIYPSNKLYYLYTSEGTLLATIKLNSEGLTLTKKTDNLNDFDYDRGLLILHYFGR